MVFAAYDRRVRIVTNPVELDRAPDTGAAILDMAPKWTQPPVCDVTAT